MNNQPNRFFTRATIIRSIRLVGRKHAAQLVKKRIDPGSPSRALIESPDILIFDAG